MNIEKNRERENIERIEMSKKVGYKRVGEERERECGGEKR